MSTVCSSSSSRRGWPSRARSPGEGDGRRTHLVYHPTAESCAALTLWMETLPPREPVRLGLQAKLAVAASRTPRACLVALEAYERECLDLAEHLGDDGGEARSWAASASNAPAALRRDSSTPRPTGPHGHGFAYTASPARPAPPRPRRPDARTCDLKVKYSTFHLRVFADPRIVSEGAR